MSSRVRKTVSRRSGVNTTTRFSATTPISISSPRTLQPRCSASGATTRTSRPKALRAKCRRLLSKRGVGSRKSELPSQHHIMRALAASLRLDRPGTEGLRTLDDADWRSLLAISDRMHVTLSLASRHRDIVPEWVRERLDRNIAGNAKCLERNRNAFTEIAAELDRQGIEVAILKGLSHDAPLRPQGDLDLFCTSETAFKAQEIVVALGYEPITQLNEFAADHLLLLIRRTGGQRRGDFFDPDKPSSAEIHFRLWCESTGR